MSNPSILAALERMWQHTVAAVGGKADADHNHDGVYCTEEEVDAKLSDVSIDEIIPMSKGGTGSDNGATGLANLFAAGETVLSSYQYGDELPSASSVGKLFLIPDNDVHIEIVKVWENASPDSNFAAQTVSLDLSDANLVIIECKASKTGSIEKFTIVKVGGAEQLFMFANAGASSEINVYTRRADITTTGVEFAAAYSKVIDGTSASSSTTYIIPLAIYAVKGVQAQ